MKNVFFLQAFGVEVKSCVSTFPYDGCKGSKKGLIPLQCYCNKDA